MATCPGVEASGIREKLTGPALAAGAILAFEYARVTKAASSPGPASSAPAVPVAAAAAAAADQQSDLTVMLPSGAVTLPGQHTCDLADLCQPRRQERRMRSDAPRLA